MADVHVDLDLLWELMGGAQLPGWLPTDAPHLALPGPHNVHAAFALVVLAQSLGAQLAPGEVPMWTLEGGDWHICAYSIMSGACFTPEQHSDAGAPGYPVLHVPTLAGISDPMAALAAVVEHAGLLYGVSRLCPTMPTVPAGEWPTWGRQGPTGCWTLATAKEVCHFADSPYECVRIPALAGVDDPAAALRAVWAHLREMDDGE